MTDWSPLQHRALAAMGYSLLAVRGARAVAGKPLATLELPKTLRSCLERWVGGQWAEWPAPEGQPGDAQFKRALWLRVRDWRRGG